MEMNQKKSNPHEQAYHLQVLLAAIFVGIMGILFLAGLIVSLFNRDYNQSYLDFGFTIISGVLIGQVVNRKWGKRK